MSKSILFLAHENEVDHILYLASKFSEQGHKVDFFVCDFFSFYAGDEYVLKKISEANINIENIFNIKDDLETMLNFNDSKNIEIDWKFLRSFEEKLSYPFIIKNMFNDFTFNEVYSPRDYYFLPKNKDLIFKLVELLCKKIDSLKVENYDIVYSASTTNFCRNIIADLAENKKIPVISIIERFYNTAFIQDTYFKKLPKYFKENFDNQELTINFLKNFTKDKPSIRDNPKYLFKDFMKNLILLMKQNYRLDRWIRLDYNLKKKNKSGNFFLKSFFYVKYTIFRDCFRNYKIYKLCNENIQYKLDNLPKTKYIYFPMHLVPESGVMNHKKFMDELFHIQILSKVLPIDYKIVVKPNPYAFQNYMNQFPFERYYKISRIPNVIMVGPDVESHFLIKHSKAVVTVSGSSSLEALFFNKPGFLFSETEFSSVDGINLFDENTFMQIIESWDEISFDRKSLYNFISNILYFGFNEVSENIIFCSTKKIKEDDKLKIIYDKILNLLNDNYLN